MKENLKDFREFKISKYRKAKKISQEQLAELIYMSRSSVSNIELNGCVDINLIAKLSEHLDFKIEIENGAIKIFDKNNIYEKEIPPTMNANKNIKEIILSNNTLNYISFTRDIINLNAYYSEIDSDSIKFSSYEDLIKSFYNNDRAVITCPGTTINIDLECTLYECDEYYAIAYIGFDATKDTHLNSYYTIYDKETLKELDICVDDIWDFRDWKEVSTN